jgi:hypothetical protein
MVGDAQVGVSIQDRLFMTATTVKDEAGNSLV